MATMHVTQSPPSLPQHFNVVAALIQLHIHILQHILLKYRNKSYFKSESNETEETRSEKEMNEGERK